MILHARVHAPLAHSLSFVRLVGSKPQSLARLQPLLSFQANSVYVTPPIANLVADECANRISGTLFVRDNKARNVQRLLLFALRSISCVQQNSIAHRRNLILVGAHKWITRYDPFCVNCVHC